jgi:hypothetical protein
MDANGAMIMSHARSREARESCAWQAALMSARITHLGIQFICSWVCFLIAGACGLR